MKRLSSIRARLTLSLLAVWLLCALLISVLLWRVVRHELDELMDQELRESAEIIHMVLSNMRMEEHTTLTTPGDSDYEQHFIWQVVDAGSGSVLSHSHRAPEQALRASQAGEFSLSIDGQWRLVTLRFGPPQRVLIVAQSQSERDEAQTEVVSYVLGASLLMGLLATLLMNLLMRRELQPLARLSHEVLAYDPLAPETEPGSAGRAELDPIAQSVRELGRRLAQHITSERAFAGHVAHALRTPVAGIDAQLAIAIREAPDALKPRLGRARDATTRLRHVMQALLALFRSGAEPQRRDITLSDLLAPLSFSALQIDLVGDRTISVDPDLMAAVLLNLIDNAQAHRAQRVEIELLQGEGWNRLRLLDDGAGCAPDRLQRLAAALARQDYGAEGALKGLGLVLADLVLRAHRGHIALPAVERGFCVELHWLQLAP